MINELKDHASAQPAAIALTASGISLPYGELYQRVVALAEVLAKRGTRRLGIGV
jgi:non-ribosomal peptide synthetase component E (peptide arylation enzyme)